MRHRLGADDAEALPVRRYRDHGCALVETAELVVRDESQRAGNLHAQRPVAGDDQLHPVRGRQQVEDSLLAREPAGVEHLRWLRLRADLVGHLDTAPDHSYLSGAELPRSICERVRGADSHSRPAQDLTRQLRSPAGELDVRPPELDDERPA